MSRQTKPKAIYRPILREALHRVFKKRDAWLFGFFALFVASGSAIEIVLRTSDGLRMQDTALLNRFFPMLEAIRQWVGQFSVVSPTRTIVTFSLIGITVLALWGLGVLSQGALLRGATKAKNKLTVHEIIYQAQPHFWALVGLNILLKLSIAVFVLIILSPTLDSLAFLTPFLTVIKSMVGFAGILGVSIIFFYAMAARVNHKQSFLGSIKEGWNTFWNNPWTSLEIAAILFLLSLTIGLMVLTVILLLLVPYTTLFLLGAAAGSSLATTIATTLTLIVVAAILIVSAASLTAYNYSVYGLTYEVLRKKGLRSKLNRIITSRHIF